jgi:hypothetical protein
MKMTVEIPDDLLLQAKAMAAIRDESLKTFITEALRAHLELQTNEAPVPGWKSVFGKARREEVETIDRLIDEELEWIKPDKEMPSCAR